MKMYVTAALRSTDPAYTPTIADTIFPPGTAFYLAMLHRLTGDWTAAAVMQVVLSALVPILLAAIAWRLYDQRVALGTLAAASLYFPFVDYSGYFLSETPYTFLLVLALALLVAALMAGQRGRLVALSFGSGAALGGAAMFKSVVLLPGLFLIIYIAGVAWRRRWRSLPALLLPGVIGMAVVLIPVAARCTRLNEGNFCLISTNGPLNVLLGHYGELRRAEFYDDVRHFRHHFGLPASILRGYGNVENFPFGVYDGDKVMAAAIEWVRQNPGTALMYSCNHVLDLFLWPHWPTSHQGHRLWATVFMQIYLVLILVPMIFVVGACVGRLWRLDRGALPEALLFLPLIGVAVVAFLTAGEPRLRIPYDGFAIILAARGFCRKLGASA
jgi:4-amino-4-deoxy-L-arabinose transferase-like glycosyltransferase